MSELARKVERPESTMGPMQSPSTVGMILVVDDEPELRNVLVEALTRQGFEVCGCSSGRRALEELRAKNFDLLLTDLMMPEMDGIALLTAALEIDPHLVGIVMTGQGTIQTAIEAMKLGAFDYVLKPFRMQTLMPVLTRAINTRHLRLENLQLRETLAIYGLSQTISFTLEPRLVLSKLADAALQQSDADEVSILLPTSDGSELYVAAVRGAQRERLLGERIPFDESIASWVARERTPVILNGPVNDERFVAFWPRPDIHSSISVPMQVANKLVGVINLNVTRRLRPFSLGQMKALTILSGTAAAALESSSLYAKLRKAEENYRSIFENAVEGFFQSTNDRKFMTVNPAMARILGYDSPEEVIATYTDFTRQLYVHPEVVPEVTQTLEAVGAVQGFEFEAYRKDREKIWLSLNVRLVRDQAGTTLYREGTIEDITERKRAELERRLMFEIIQGAITTPNLDELLKLIHTSIGKLLDAENCFVALHDPKSNLMHYEFWADKFDPAPASRPLGTGFSSYVVRTSQPLLLTAELMAQLEARAEVIPSGRPAQSWLGVPLRTSSATIGVLVLQHYEIGSAYTQRDLELLSSVGDQIALAIERKRAEVALAESEERKDAILRSALEGVVTIDHEGKVIDFNPAAESMFGYSSESIVGKGLAELIIPPRQRGLHSAGFARFLATGRSTILGKRVEGLAMRADGSEIPVELTITAIGELPRPKFTAFIRDLTERNEAEANLRQSEERYRELVENAHDIIYEQDLKGNFTSINKAGEEITGYSREETLTLNYEQTIAPEYFEKAREMVKRKLAGERLTAYDLEIIAKDGRRVPVEVNTSLVFHQGVPVGVQGIARDVTERKHLEEQLRQSQKLEAIGQLAGGIAHDFNNLLTVIGGYSDLLMRRLPGDSPFRSNVEEIKKAGDRATILTRQLLAFSRKQILQPKVLDLNAVVSDLDKMLRRLIGEDIDLLTITEPRLGQVKADPGQIEQVVVNLIVNARDAMSLGGKLTLETANVELTEAYTQQHAEGAPGNYVMLAVSDTGCGMDPELKTHIFEPFFSTKGPGKGTGLGLSTVYGIVRQSGGNIWVYSELGKGTTFKIYLPRVDEAVDNEDARAAPGATPQGTETLLLVEDEGQVRIMAQQILDTLGYVVLAAENGEQALALARAYRSEIHLMITDVVMPQMGGPELVKRLAPLRPNMRVLYMSGYTDDAIVRHGLMDEQLEFIQKPFSADALARKVRKVLEAQPNNGT